MKNLAVAVILVFSPALAGHAADAKATWAELCLKCHGAEGKGDTKMGKILDIKDYTDAKVQAGFTDEAAVKSLLEGIKDRGGATRMKAVEGLTAAEAKDLVALVRDLKK
jgi:cytochrome c553